MRERAIKSIDDKLCENIYNVVEYADLNTENGQWAVMHRFLEEVMLAMDAVGLCSAVLELEAACCTVAAFRNQCRNKEST